MASYTKIIQNAVKIAFDSVGDLGGTFTVRTETSVFDPLTSLTVTTNKDVEGVGIIDSSEIKYLDNTNLTNRYITLWLSTSVEPKLSDKMVMPDGSFKNILIVNPIVSYNTNFIYEVGLAA